MRGRTKTGEGKAKKKRGTGKEVPQSSQREVGSVKERCKLHRAARVVEGSGERGKWGRGWKAREKDRRSRGTEKQGVVEGSW